MLTYELISSFQIHNREVLSKNYKKLFGNTVVDIIKYADGYHHCKLNKISKNIRINGNIYLIGKQYDFYMSDIIYDDLGKMFVNGLGFSDKYPGLYFELYNNNESPRKFFLKIHEITADFMIPESIFNNVKNLTHDQIKEFRITEDGVVTSEKYKNYFRNIIVKNKPIDNKTYELILI